MTEGEEGLLQPPRRYRDDIGTRPIAYGPPNDASGRSERVDMMRSVQQRLRAVQDARHIRGVRAVAAQQTMSPEREEVATLDQVWTSPSCWLCAGGSTERCERLRRPLTTAATERHRPRIGPDRQRRRGVRRPS